MPNLITMSALPVVPLISMGPVVENLLFSVQVSAAESVLVIIISV